MKHLSLLLACAIALMPLAAPGRAAQRSAADQALLNRAIKACNGPQYPSGARPVVNYGRGTFKCVELGTERR